MAVVLHVNIAIINKSANYFIAHTSPIKFDYSLSESFKPRKSDKLS